MKFRGIILVTSIVAALVGASAVAQEKPPETTPAKATPPAGEDLSPKERASQLATEGRKLAQNGQFQEAAAKFKESLNIFPITDVYFNLAYSYEQLGEWKGCVANYRLYIKVYRETHNATDPPDIIGVDRSIEKCKEIAQPPITITSNPEGAQVALSEAHNLVGSTPLTRKLDPGTYKVFLTKPDYVTVEAQIQVLPKQSGKYHFDLAKVIKSGTVSLSVNVRDATIYIDGKNVGITPYAESPKLEVGPHQIVIKKDRYTSVNRTFQIEESSNTNLEFQLFLIDPQPSWRSYLGWTGISIGVVSIAGGVVAYLLAEEEFSDSNAFKKLEMYQFLGYGLGGSLLGVGTGLLIWEAVRDAVDTDDLVGSKKEMPFHIGFFPTSDGGHVYGMWRF